VTEWDGSTLVLLTNEEIDVLPEPDKGRYIERLLGHAMDNGHEASPWFREWKKFDARCREVECTGMKLEPHDRCPRHLPLEKIDPDAAIRQRNIRNRLRLLELSDKAVDELDRILNSGDDIPAAVRLKAIDSILDRTGVPRQTASSVQVDAEVTVTSIDAAEVIRGRLDRLATTFVTGELEGIAEVSALNREIEE
jgi:hypothetical protein